jgi:hypothetical protein
MAKQPQTNVDRLEDADFAPDLEKYQPIGLKAVLSASLLNRHNGILATRPSANLDPSRLSRLEESETYETEM